MKILSILSLVFGLNAAEIKVTDRISGFALPEDTTQWAISIMALVRDVLPQDTAAQEKFQELVDWSCGDHADLKNADSTRRAETIRLSMDRLAALTTSSARVAYISVQLERHKRYVPKK